MNRERLRVSLMTAGFTPGDAISNYILTLARILRGWGARVDIYADAIASELHAVAQPSRFYQPTGRGLLWFHYSIEADNVDIALGSRDAVVMDYHGICPPHLFHGQNPHLEMLCRRGIDRLPELAGRFERVAVHSESARRELLAAGFDPAGIRKFYLPVDTARFSAADEDLAVSLSRLRYCLMVGRIVPQKDVSAAIEIVAQARRFVPDLAFILAGNRDQARAYQGELDRLVASRGLDRRVLFAGQVSNPAVLAALYREASLLLVTSEWESFCVPIAEAMHFGVPVAVHDQEPMTEIAGTGGLVIDKARPEESAERIAAVLNDPERVASLSTAARARSALYRDDALAAAILDFLAEAFGVGERP
jgi:glycosyltransferase involved in cell wall biosynthesis